MYNKIMETLENLEDKIESIKWLLASRVFVKRNGASEAMYLIKRSAGILGKASAKGTLFENRVRRGWTENFLRRSG